MPQVNVSEQLLECLIKEGERSKEQVFNMLLEPEESWSDLMVRITVVMNSFERFGCVNDMAKFIEKHGRNGIDTLYAALGELNALDNQIRDIAEEVCELESRLAKAENQSKEMCIRLGVPYGFQERLPVKEAANTLTAKSRHRAAMIASGAQEYSGTLCRTHRI